MIAAAIVSCGTHGRLARMAAKRLRRVDAMTTQSAHWPWHAPTLADPQKATLRALLESTEHKRDLRTLVADLAHAEGRMRGWPVEWFSIEVRWATEEEAHATLQLTRTAKALVPALQAYRDAYRARARLYPYPSIRPTGVSEKVWKSGERMLQRIEAACTTLEVSAQFNTNAGSGGRSRSDAPTQELFMALFDPFGLRPQGLRLPTSRDLALLALYCGFIPEPVGGGVAAKKLARVEDTSFSQLVERVRPPMVKAYRAFAKKWGTPPLASDPEG